MPRDAFAFADFFKSGYVSVIVGGQFGSEAKGLAAAIVAGSHSAGHPPLICTTNAGAQAGHTTVLADGRKFVCYHLPTIGVLCREAFIFLNAGSIIDPQSLILEIKNVAAILGQPEELLRKRIAIHPHAAIISGRHGAEEGLLNSHASRIGSTRKGVGEALVDKIRRMPEAVAENCQLLKDAGLAIDTGHLSGKLMRGWAVTVEVPQGTSLSINAGGFYPYCTSRDCWVGQGLTDAGLHPLLLSRVMIVQRTFPIRVGHIYDKPSGEKIGDSGPFYPDSQELDWAEDLPHLLPEITTVTKRVRRIATWSAQQYHDGLLLNLPSHVLTTFCNYFRNPVEFAIFANRMKAVEQAANVWPEHFWSFGPATNEWTDDPKEVEAWLASRPGMHYGVNDGHRAGAGAI